jgi:protein SCO1/2
MARSFLALTLQLAAAVVIVGGAAAYVLGVGPFAGQLQEVAEEQGQALIGGPFELVEHTGRTVTEADYAGRLKLIYFGYTYCPDVCPLGLAKIAAAYDLLRPDEQAQLVPLFITVDPERDTVAAVADYVDLFHPALVGLTGTPEQVAAAAAVYRVYYRKAESESTTDYLVDHSSFTYLMDGDNHYLTHFGHDATPEAIAEGIRQQLGRAATS